MMISRTALSGEGGEFRMAAPSPMPVKYRVIFLLLSLIVMGCFAGAAISFSSLRYAMALFFLLLALLLIGLGFVVRKRILLRLLGEKRKG